MSGYTPRVGDKVRATLGESVVVGVVAEQGLGSLLTGLIKVVDPASGTSVDLWAGTGNGWLFEQVVSVPSKFGAVIRRADGLLLIHFGDGQWCTSDHHEYVNADLQGGFTILFDGVDE